MKQFEKSLDKQRHCLVMGKIFYEDIKIMETRYQGWLDVSMMAEYCWMIRDCSSEEEHGRKSTKTRFCPYRWILSQFHFFKILPLNNCNSWTMSSLLLTSETILYFFVSVSPEYRTENIWMELKKNSNKPIYIYIIWFVQNSDVMAKFHQHIWNRHVQIV